jgi:hypothetical protein
MGASFNSAEGMEGVCVREVVGRGGRGAGRIWSPRKQMEVLGDRREWGSGWVGWGGVGVGRRWKQSLLE